MGRPVPERYEPPPPPPPPPRATFEATTETVESMQPAAARAELRAENAGEFNLAASEVIGARGRRGGLAPVPSAGRAAAPKVRPVISISDALHLR